MTKHTKCIIDQLKNVSKEKSCIIELTVYEAGSYHIDHVDNQNFYGVNAIPLAESKKENTEAEQSSPLPKELCTEEAMILWKKAQDAGYVDACYQPLISRTQSALLADAMAERLGINNKWKVFETLWNRKYMYRDYYEALNQKKSLIFQGELKKLFY